MSDSNEVVYSYEADSSGIMESIDAIMEGITGLIEEIGALVDASGELAALGDAFTGVADSLAGVDATASEAVAGIGGVTDEAGMAADALDAMGAAGDAIAGIGGVADEAVAGIGGVVDEAGMAADALDAMGASGDAIAGLTDTVSMLSETVAEDTALIDSLNTTIANLEAQVAALTGEFDTAEASATGFGVSVSGFDKAQGPLMMLGMAGVMAGKSFLDMGSKAEDSLNQVQALAGVGASDMAKYTSGLEDQSRQLGESLDQEAQGLFFVTSAGFQGAGALGVLKQATMDAKAGNIDLATSAKGLDAVLNTYGASADQAAQYNDIMVTAVTKGSQTFGDFASAISKAAVEGHAAHISFNQVAAAESEMTTVGVTARQSSMDLTSMMKAMDGDIDKTATTAKKLGLNFNEASFKTMDLFHQMTYLQEITKGNQTELGKLTGGSAGLAGFNALMTKNSDGSYKFAQSLDAMKNSSGAAAQAFATSQDTISAHMAKIQASLSVISYKVLENLAPVINRVADAFGKAADFLSQHMDIVMPVLAGFAVLIGGVVVAALYSMLAPLFAITVTIGSLSAPFLAIAAVVAAVVAGIVYAVEHWGDITNWLKSVWAGVPGFFGGIWQNIRGGVSGVGDWFKDKWTDATTSAVNSFEWLYNHNYYFKSLTDAAKTATTDAGNFLKEAWKTATTDTVSAWNTLKDKAEQLWVEISTPFKNAWSQHIAPPLNSLWNNAKSLWGTFVADAENLGKNLVSHIASGISSKAGEAGQAAQNIGNKIATLLGFHNIAGIVEKNSGTIVQTVRNMGSGMVTAAQQGGANLLSWWNGLASSFTNSPLGGTITKTLQDAFGQVGQQFGQIGQQLKTNLGGAISGIMPSLSNLGGSFKLVWDDLSKIGQIMSGSFMTGWRQLQDAFSQIGKLLGGPFITGWHQLQDAFGAVGKALASIPWHTLQQALAQIGAVVGGAFMTAWKALKPVFDQVGQAFSFVGKILGGSFMDTLKGLGILIGGVLLIAISAILGAIVGLAKGLATFIGGIAKVIGGVVQIFSGVIQIVSGIIAFIVDLFTGHFNKLGADLGVIWNGIKTMFAGVWNVIQGLFQATVGTLVAIISGFVGTIITFFVGLGDSMGLHVSAMINGVVNWFEQLPGRAMNFIHSLVDGITTTLGGLGAKALTWAGDMINQFIQGIENGIGAVGDAVQKIAGKIASFLHFSKPDVGPLVDVDNWMPDFMNLLSKGIDDNINKVKTSALGIATAINTSAPNPSNLPSGPNAGRAVDDQVVQILQKLLGQQSQRQQLPAPTSANLGAFTQNFGNLNFHGVQDANELYQQLNALQGQAFEQGQRGALFNN